MIELSSSEKETLMRLHGLGTQAERQSQTQCPELVLGLQNFLGHKQISLHRLAELASRPGLRLLDLLVPLERLLDRTVSDDQFLVTDLDQPQSLQKIPGPRLILVLENLRSAFNVGSIFRVAECVGNCEIYLCGYTATPRESQALRKTSMGTSEIVPWRSWKNLTEVFQEFEEKKVQTLAMETAKKSKPLKSIAPNSDILALIVGNERFGLDHGTLQRATNVAHIPCYGSKNSLNVSTAISVAAYHFRSLPENT